MAAFGICVNQLLPRLKSDIQIFGKFPTLSPCVGEEGHIWQMSAFSSKLNGGE